MLQKRSLGDMLWDSLEQERSIELSAVATSLVRFYLSQDLIVEFLDALIVRDIERTGKLKPRLSLRSTN